MKKIVLYLVILLTLGCRSSNQFDYHYENRLSRSTQNNLDLENDLVVVTKVKGADAVIVNTLLTTFTVEMKSISTNKRYTIKFYNGKLSYYFIEGQTLTLLFYRNSLFDIKELIGSKDGERGMFIPSLESIRKEIQGPLNYFTPK